jgi:hydroxyethylthiazole kinase-like uncharacterized protein yjeF
MLNLLISSQIKEADAQAISSRNISSLELTESASLAFADEFKKEIGNKNTAISVYCGTGNNGGDGLAVARLLNLDGYQNVSVKILRFSKSATTDFDANLNRLKSTGVPIEDLAGASAVQNDKSTIIIDALLGSGLNKPVSGDLKTLIEQINKSGKKIISVDVPSGFPSEGIINPQAVTLKTDLAISFQRPKINFFFPESAGSLGRFKVVPIGLDEKLIQSLKSGWKLIEDQDIKEILKVRKAFTHKGTYGHALIIAGAKETMGAALLCADACLHAGAGLTTACIPESGLTALNSRSPELMALIRGEKIGEQDFSKYSSIAFGPGTGKEKATVQLFGKVLGLEKVPLILDADALSILAENLELLNKIPSQCILTPHMKEFDRLFGDHSTWWERIDTARKYAKELNIIILLKNQYSFIVLPDGNVLINPTGNPAMAIGGMGDVLTGMIAAFLAQGYSPKDSAIIACYLHGKAGDELNAEGMNSIPPRYLIKKLPFVLNEY